MKKNRKKIIIISVAILSVLVVTFSIGFSNGWFENQKVTLSQEYYNTKNEFLKLDTESYNKLVEEKKSFLIITYLPGCTAKIIEFVNNFSKEHNVAFYYYNFADFKNSELHNSIKYAPSVAIISEGKLVKFLRSDSNDDAKYYNSYESFKTWLESLIVL